MIGFDSNWLMSRMAREKAAAYPAEPVIAGDAVEYESDLSQAIIQFCNEQFPRWKFIIARTDRRSTIGIGIHDATLYLPNGRVLNCELKAKGGKLSPEQRVWIKELEMLGHTVHVIDSMKDFYNLIEIPKSQ